MGVKLKKAKPSPKTGKLLAQVKKAVGQALKKKLKAQMEGLPQVDVPITSTPIKGEVKSLGTVGDTPKKHAEAKAEEKEEFFGKLIEASNEIFANTTAHAVTDVEDVKLVDIAGVSTLTGKATLDGDPEHGCMYMALASLKTPAEDCLAYEIMMKARAEPDSFMPNSAQTVIKARKDAEIHHDLMVHALADTPQASLVLPVPLRDKYEDAEDYRFRLRVWWDDAHEFFCTLAAESRATQAKVADLTKQVQGLVGFKMEDFLASPVIYTPVHTSTGLMPSKEQEAELEYWICHSVKCVLESLSFEPFDDMGLLKIRGMLSKHYDATVECGGVGPPALFGILGKEAVMHRVAQRLCEAMSVLHGKLSPAELKMFNKVFPAVGFSAKPISSALPGTSPIVTMNEITEWMRGVAQIVFDFIHWQTITKELLLAVRKYIEDGYEEDLIPKLPSNFDAFGKVPKEGVVHRTAMRVRHMLVQKAYGEGGPFTDETDVLFKEVFPLPDGAKIGALGSLTPGVKIGPAAPILIKNEQELIEAFGKPEAVAYDSKKLNYYTALLLQKTHEYLEAHPEAAGVGPLDGAGILQTLAPFQVVPNKNGHVYAADVWDKAVKKLQPKFSVEAEADAKEQGLGEAVEDVISMSSQDPGIIPEAEVKIITEGDVAYLVTTINGEVVDKKEIAGASVQQITQRGYATLDRFGAVLVSDPVSPGIYPIAPPPVGSGAKVLVPPVPANHIELSFTMKKNKGGS